MMLRILFLGIILISTFNSNAQKSVNDYKYVVIPEGYAFLKGKKDGYQLNSLTKFLFKKYGFQAFLQEEALPEDLNANGCKALRVDVLKKPGLFQTKLAVELKDCNGGVVFLSSDGVSREKDFRAAYHGALRAAFKDVEMLNYSYSGDNENEVVEQKNAKTTVVEPKKPIEVAETNEVVKAPPVSENSIAYVFNNSKYIFMKQDYGFEIFKNEGEQVPIGKIYKSTGTYIVKAGDLSGNGYFDAYGNFILERINPVTDKLIKDTFARQ